MHAMVHGHRPQAPSGSKVDEVKLPLSSGATQRIFLPSMPSGLHYLLIKATIKQLPIGEVNLTPNLILTISLQARDIYLTDTTNRSKKSAPPTTNVDGSEPCFAVDGTDTLKLASSYHHMPFEVKHEAVLVLLASLV
jgi:hypothetical protein